MYTFFVFKYAPDARPRRIIVSQKQIFMNNNVVAWIYTGEGL